MILAYALLLAPALLHAASGALEPTRLQVAILQQAASAHVFVDGKIAVVSPGGRSSPLNWKGEVILRPREEGLILADMRLPSETRLVPRNGARIRVGPNYHRGTLILRLDPGQTVSIIEELSLEDYLEGVLPFEMNPDWPLEALKAQAVVARTFTLANMGKFRREGFDLTSDTRSQVYKGLSGVNENVRVAVRQTRGEVLGFQGKLLHVYYHSCCGGSTTDAAAAWSSSTLSPRPLRGVRDPWCRLSPHMKWSAHFAWADLTAAISEKRMLSGPLYGLKIGSRDAAGYVRTFLAKAGGKTTEVKAADLRSSLGAGDVKSVRVSRLKITDYGVEFFGSGSGHGVGLCQWGTRQQALNGRNYDRILHFYFPGAVLSLIDG
ncbi:MAG: SpoIID/LytB domain-containing protein [Elusimicrobiota bacterium]